LTSKNFCRSAWNGFLLVVKNAFRFGFVHSIGAIFMFIGRLFIICCTVLCCYIMLTEWPHFEEKVSSPYFPCVIAGIIGLLVGSIFMSVFSFACDTILQCFFLDEELGASNSRPQGNRPPIMNDFISKAAGGNMGCCC
jgi:solute carrier family 44 (choline transporter-like protein), member 2/4/5